MSGLRNCISCGARAVPADDGIQTCSACGVRQEAREITPQSRPWRRRVVPGLIGLAVLVAVAMAVRHVMLLAGRAHDQIHCSSNLRNIGQAILAYARDHGGRFPSGWDDLPSQPGIGCTLDRGYAGTPPIAYVYIGAGLYLHTTPDDRLVAFEPFPLHELASFLYADGHVESRPRDEAIAELNRVAVQRVGSGNPKPGRPIQKSAWPPDMISGGS